MKKLEIIIWGITLLVSLNLNAENRGIEINDLDGFINPALKSSFFVDEENTLEIHDILDQKYQDKFVRNEQEIPHFGLTESSIWLKFDIVNNTEANQFLEIDNPVLDTVEYFLVDSQGSIIYHSITGNHKKIEYRDVQSRELLLNLHLAKSESYICYLRINANSSTILAPLRIASLSEFYELKQMHWDWQNLFFGLIIFLFLYNLFLFYSLKDVTYLYFSLFIGFMGLLFALFRGLVMQYVWSSFPVMNQLTPLIASIAAIFMILFSAKFLNSKSKYPKTHIWLLGLIGLYIVIGLMNIFGLTLLATNLVLINSMMGLTFLMFIAIKSWREGYEPAKYYLFAWSFYVIGVFTSYLRDNNFIEVNLVTANILQITTAMSMLFMSFALSKKINIYIRSKNDAQLLAIEAALENEKLISNQNILLEAKVNQRTSDLEETVSTLSKQRKDLHEANSFKDKVFSIISHDLKSPISTLAGMLNVMKLSTLSELERANVVDKLEIALKNTKILLDNILIWANKSENNAKEVEEIELRVCVEDIIELFQYQAANKHIKLVNNIESGFHIQANKNMLQLVLRNLISNSLKFTPKDGMVSVNMKEEFQNLYLSIEDTGVGMNQEVLSNLFKANKHTSSRGTENEKGTGLGLKLCKEFVDKFNGELEVKSEVGQGSTFTVKLKDAIPIMETVFS